MYCINSVHPSAFLSICRYCAERDVHIITVSDRPITLVLWAVTLSQNSHVKLSRSYFHNFCAVWLLTSIRDFVIVFIVFSFMCSVSWLFWFSCQYLPSPWLERLLSWRFSWVEEIIWQRPAWRMHVFCLFFWVMMFLSPAVSDLFQMPMAWYILFMLKVPLNGNQPTNLLEQMYYWLMNAIDSYPVPTEICMRIS